MDNTAAPSLEAMELPKSPPKPRAAPGMREPLWDRWSTHPGRKLTPAKLITAYDAAEEGDPIDQCDIFEDRVEFDAHLRSIIEGRVDAVARKRWVLLPGGDSATDVRAARLLEEYLQQVPNFIETLEHQLWFNYYGWSSSEIEWKRVDGKWVPASFENVAWRRFRFDRQDRPLLITDVNPLGEPLQAGGWWTTRRRGRISAISGYLRTATWWSLFKSYSVRDWMVWANRFGLPSVHGVYEDDAAPDDITALKKAVQALGRDGWAVFNKACEIVITQTQAGGKAEDVHGALTALCDTQNSKLIAGATLLTETTGQASYAIGRVHEGRGFQLIDGDASRLAGSFRVHVSRPFVEFNGLRARPPVLKIYIVQDMAPETRAKIFAVALNELRIPLDEDQVRQELQLKKPAGAALDPPPVPAEPKESPDGPDTDPA